MMWQRILAGFRAVGSGMRSKLLFVAGIIVFFALYILVPRIRAVRASDSMYGDWMGTVSITKSVPKDNLNDTESQGTAVMRVKLSPVWFSFLDRTESTAVLIDADGVRHTFGISDLADGWAFRKRWSSKQLLAGGTDETIIGQWNRSFPDFVLKFDSFGNNEFSDGTTYRISGSLKRGDEATLQSLVQNLSSAR
ncbi:hypothetical protein [Granulicella mallensis]|uniref:Uncharacterized protein n=1 Tax=Granulicella mallensis TaxID=940614 RepID=A0A7W7ZP67_9BACT|nr:hypothetical protein [Granulicella mallensis]MBB5063238.1 hypothetical protein [Granulicella mallensis]